MHEARGISTELSWRRGGGPGRGARSLGLAVTMAISVTSIISAPVAAAATPPAPRWAMTGATTIEPAPAGDGGDASATPEDTGSMERAKVLFKEGFTASRLGKFEEALAKFEEAYGLSGKPLLLFNIGLTLRSMGERDRDVARLREARAMFKNFIRETQRDPSLAQQVDPDAVAESIAAVNKLIEELEREDAERADAEARRAAEVAAAQAAYEPVGADPGTPFRKRGNMWLGIGAGGGGVLTATGLALVAVFGAQAGAADVEARNNEQDQATFACDNPLDASVLTCLNLVQDAEAINARGTRAQRNMLAIGLPVAVVGVGLLGTGVALGILQRNKGKEKTRAWREGPRAFVVPTLGGVTVQGRF